MKEKINRNTTKANLLKIEERKRGKKEKENGERMEDKFDVFGIHGRRL